LPFRRATPFEQRLGHRFRRRELLACALTHRSFARERESEEHYERLEFLGDAVLKLVTAEWLFERHPERREGPLSKQLAQLVSATALAPYAAALGLGEELRLGVGEERSGGRGKRSLLADSLEAVFGAVYLDGGLDAVRPVIHRMLETAAGEGTDLRADAKTTLQELAQARGLELPLYRLVAATGPDHSKRFSVECWLAGELAGRGEGASKKVAEQRAAADALGRLVSHAVSPRPDPSLRSG
jgi:ribonuclease-3